MEPKLVLGTRSDRGGTAGSTAALEEGGGIAFSEGEAEKRKALS